MIIALEEGHHITPTRLISPTMVAHWKYATECADIGGGIFPGARMRVAEVSKKPGAMWVRAELPGRTPPQCLKIAGEEFAHNFRPIR